MFQQIIRWNQGANLIVMLQKAFTETGSIVRVSTGQVRQDKTKKCKMNICLLKFPWDYECKKRKKCLSMFDNGLRGLSKCNRRKNILQVWHWWKREWGIDSTYRFELGKNQPWLPVEYRKIGPLHRFEPRIGIACVQNHLSSRISGDKVCREISAWSIGYSLSGKGPLVSKSACSVQRWYVLSDTVVAEEFVKFGSFVELSLAMNLCGHSFEPAWSMFLIPNTSDLDVMVRFVS